MASAHTDMHSSQMNMPFGPDIIAATWCGCLPQKAQRFVVPASEFVAFLVSCRLFVFFSSELAVAARDVVMRSTRP